MTEQKNEVEHNLRLLGERFVAQFNALAEQLEHADTEQLQGFYQLPTTVQLDEIEAFSRTLTQEPWDEALPQDRAHMYEIRCIISDAVWYANQLDYNAATEQVQKALRKLMQMRKRRRSKVFPEELEEAVEAAAGVMMDVIAMFIEADRVISNGQGVLPRDSSATR